MKIKPPFLVRQNKTSDEIGLPNDSEAVGQGQNGVDDILEALRINPSVEVPDEVLLPDELKDIKFDIQVPRGYDEGQVTKFIAQVTLSINFLVDALRKRNEDVAKLASAVDKLQVDANNLRFDNEVNNGVSIMSAFDPEDAESKLVEAKLMIKSLKDQLKSLESSGDIKLPDSNTISVVDKNSALLAEIAALKEELSFLRSGSEGSAAPSLPSVLPKTDISQNEYSETISLPNVEIDTSDDSEDELDELMRRLKGN